MSWKGLSNEAYPMKSHDVNRPKVMKVRLLARGGGGVAGVVHLISEFLSYSTHGNFFGNSGSAGVLLDG